MNICTKRTKLQKGQNEILSWYELYPIIGYIVTLINWRLIYYMQISLIVFFVHQQIILKLKGSIDLTITSESKLDEKMITGKYYNKIK